MQNKETEKKNRSIDNGEIKRFDCDFSWLPILYGYLYNVFHIKQK